MRAKTSASQLRINFGETSGHNQRDDDSGALDLEAGAARVAARLGPDRRMTLRPPAFLSVAPSAKSKG
jgi:hypothetical protein